MRLSTLFPQRLSWRVLSCLTLAAQLLGGCSDQGYLLGATPRGALPPSEGGHAGAAGAGAWDCRGLKTVRPEPSALEPPSYLEPVVDPDYGVVVTRITGDPGAAISGTSAAWQRKNGMIWQLKQVFNADESLLYLHFGGPLLLDGTTYEVVRALEPPAIGTWHPVDPELMLYAEGEGIRSYNVLTDEVRTVVSLAGYSDLVNDYAEDKLSADGRYMVVLAVRQSDAQVVAFAIDLVRGEKHADIVLAEHGFSLGSMGRHPESITWSGRHVVLRGGASVNGEIQPEVIKVFDREGRAVTEQVERYMCPAMGDTAIGPQGEDFEVGRCDDEAGELLGKLVRFDYDSGGVVPIGPACTFSSSRSYRRPGWSYCSSNDDGGIYAVRHDGARTEQIVDARLTLPVDYWAEPHAVPSPTGTRVVFQSNWGTGDPGDDDAQVFIADFRALCAW